MMDAKALDIEGALLIKNFSREDRCGLFVKPFTNIIDTLKELSLVVYNQSSVYSKEQDYGILWNSFGYDWEVDQPILSDRDQSFITLNKYISPFN